MAGDALGIEPAEAHVWFASATALSPRAPELTRLLGDLEQERMARFRHARDRERFAIRRGVLRVLLASYLGERPAQGYVAAVAARVESYQVCVAGWIAAGAW